MKITWTKIKKTGDWGIRGPAAALTPGAVQVVVRKDGSSSEVEVDSVVWSDGQTAIATVTTGYGRRAVAAVAACHTDDTAGTADAAAVLEAARVRRAEPAGTPAPAPSRRGLLAAHRARRAAAAQRNACGDPCHDCQ
jgi:phage tail tape-measure protein